VIAGVVDRSSDLHALRERLTRALGTTDGRPAFQGIVQAGQVHGASLAAIESSECSDDPIPGCDGLATRLPGLALVIRTADCLPIFIWDPLQGVAGLVHAGWRGLAKQLPLRVASFLRQWYRSQPHDLWIGIGPAIRGCCYEVEPGFKRLFGAWVSETNGRWTCDLVGCATGQLLAAGVRPARLQDCGRCTSCDSARWYSVRREGETTARLYSFIMLLV
jgi:YfiH family protein